MELSYNYPTLEDIDLYWSEALSEIPSRVEPVETRERDTGPDYTIDRHSGAIWLRFEGTDGIKFWCLWQPCGRPGPRKTLIHLPGYGTEVSAHASLVHAGYNVMHINPRGYCGPDGFANPEWRSQEGGADVLYRNLDKPEEYGYRFWFQDAVIAVRWLQDQSSVSDRFGFFGSSQGGGGSLLLASILSPEGIVGAVAADVPYLTNFPLATENEIKGGYDMVLSRLSNGEGQYRQAFHTLGYVDTVVHAPRMQYPVLLTIGADDFTCPAYSIYSLYEKLPNTRAVVEIHEQGHAYTPPFPSLAEAWFGLYL